MLSILIGAGRPVATFELFSFKWLINSHPFGGLTLCDLPPNRERWRLVTISSIAGVIFRANAVVVADNLIPMRINAFHGPTANDGLLILQLLGWKEKREQRHENEGRAKGAATARDFDACAQDRHRNGENGKQEEEVEMVTFEAARTVKAARRKGEGSSARAQPTPSGAPHLEQTSGMGMDVFKKFLGESRSGKQLRGGNGCN